MAWFKPRFKPSNPSCPVQFIPSVQPGRLLLLISKLQDGGGDEGNLLPQEWFQSPSRAGFWGGSAWVSAPGNCFCPCKSTTVFGSAGSVCSAGDGKQQRKLFKINFKKKKIQVFPARFCSPGYPAKIHKMWQSQESRSPSTLSTVWPRCHRAGDTPGLVGVTWGVRSRSWGLSLARLELGGHVWSSGARSQPRESPGVPGGARAVSLCRGACPAPAAPG